MFSKSKVRIKSPDKIFEAELADTFLSKFLGFRFRSNGKMLFPFSRNTRALIDMMFVREPLFLYFLDSDKKVIAVQKAKPLGFKPDTWKLYRSEDPYRYLLESFDNLGLSEGDRLEFEV